MSENLQRLVALADRLANPDIRFRSGEDVLGLISSLRVTVERACLPEIIRPLPCGAIPLVRLARAKQLNMLNRLQLTPTHLALQERGQETTVLQTVLDNNDLKGLRATNDWEDL